jgi:putative sterol carrier protein
MTDVSQFANASPAEFAGMIKSSSNDQLLEMISGPQRKALLDTIFGKMPSQFRADKAGNTNAAIHWIIGDGPDGGTDTYEVNIADGACTVSPNPTGEPKLALTMSGVDFLKIVSGNANPVMLFMTGKLKAKGDLGLAANIANLFDLPKA